MDSSRGLATEDSDYELRIEAHPEQEAKSFASTFSLVSYFALSQDAYSLFIPPSLIQSHTTITLETTIS